MLFKTELKLLQIKQQALYELQDDIKKLGLIRGDEVIELLEMEIEVVENRTLRVVLAPIRPF